MNIGAYTHQTTLQRHKMHVRINELERENKALARTCKRLRATIEKLRERGPGFVFGQSGKVLEQFRRAL